MSLLPYALARPFLFGLDPETAHELTLHTLARVQGTPLAWAYCNRRVEDPVVLAGLKFPNRVGLAAGLVMGYSSRLAFGCNVGALLSGVSTGSLHGWIWLPLAFAGTLVGVRVRRHFGF